MCGPRGLPGESDHLFHNNGDGTFTDVSVKAGVSDPSGYYGLAAAFVDVDDDGWVDLVVANDSTPNYLYRNKHNGTFEDVSYASGFALSEDGREQASMGIGIGDYQRNGRIDLFTTTFSDDYKTLYRNDGQGSFSDVTYQAGLAGPTIPFLSWGTGFLDFDNDGWLDLFIANGHVYPEVDKQDWGTTWAERPQLFRNLDGKKFQEVPPATGSGLADVISARGAAFGDIFNDGAIDVVINNIDSRPTLLRNVLKTGNHWLELKLIGGPKSPRDANGAKVFLTIGGIRQRGDVYSGGSYSSSSDQRIHFGLGTATAVDSIEIYWPSGAKEKVTSTGHRSHRYRRRGEERRRSEQTIIAKRRLSLPGAWRANSSGILIRGHIAVGYDFQRVAIQQVGISLDSPFWAIVSKSRGRQSFGGIFTSLPAPTLSQTVPFAGMDSVMDAGWSAFPGTGVAFKTPVISKSVVFVKQ